MNPEVKKLLSELVQHLHKEAEREEKAVVPPKYPKGSKVIYVWNNQFKTAKVLDVDLPGLTLSFAEKDGCQVVRYEVPENLPEVLPYPEFRFKVGDRVVYTSGAEQSRSAIEELRVSEETGDKEYRVYNGWVSECGLQVDDLVHLYQVGQEVFYLDRFDQYEKAKILWYRYQDCQRYIKIHLLRRPGCGEDWIPESSDRLKPVPVFRFQIGDLVQHPMYGVGKVIRHTLGGMNAEPAVVISSNDPVDHVALEKDVVALADQIHPQAITKLLDEDQAYDTVVTMIRMLKPAELSVLFWNRYRQNLKWDPLHQQHPEARIWEALLETGLLEWSSLWCYYPDNQGWSLGAIMFFTGTDELRKHMVAYFDTNPALLEKRGQLNQIWDEAVYQWSIAVLPFAFRLVKPTRWDWRSTLRNLVSSQLLEEENPPVQRLKDCLAFLLQNRPKELL